MRIIITGATGFVGGALCRFFANKGHEIIAIGRQSSPPPRLLDYASYTTVDITKPFSSLEGDICIHAAALASDTASYTDLYSANVLGTKHTLASSVNCRYFIYISSSSVYPSSKEKITESCAHTIDELSNYGKTKLLSEQLVASSQTTQQTKLILRPRAIYGIGDRVLLPRILNLIKGNYLFCPVNANVLTSLTHIDNIAQVIDLYLSKDVNETIQVYNVADDPIYKLRDVLIRIASEMKNQPIYVKQVPESLLNIAVKMNDLFHVTPKLNKLVVNSLAKNSVLDTHLIKKELGFNPEYNFDNSFPKVIDWINSMGGYKHYIKNNTSAPWLV